MDHTTSVAFRLSQHQAADLARDAERRRSIAERLERTGAGAAAPTRARRRTTWVPRGSALRSPRIVVSVTGLVLMGSILGFAALPSGAPDAPSPVAPVIFDAPAGGGTSGVGFIAQ